jgi:hypothetical protein
MTMTSYQELEEKAKMWEETAMNNYKLYTESIKRCIELQKLLDAYERKEQETERCVNCSCSDCDD